MWVGHSCPTPLTLPLVLGRLIARESFDFTQIKDPKSKASDKSVRPTHNLPILIPPIGDKRLRHASACRLSWRVPVIVVVMGVTGAGKTTIGVLLAQRLGWEFADADSFHSPANVEKIRLGIPLDDADRAPWLRSLRQAMERLVRGTQELRTGLLGAQAELSRRALHRRRDQVRLPEGKLRPDLPARAAAARSLCLRNDIGQPVRRAGRARRCDHGKH